MTMNDTVDETPTQGEVKTAIKGLQIGKAPRIDFSY